MSKTITEPEDNDSAPLMACAWCSVPFEIYPDCFIEVGLSRAQLSDEEGAVLCEQMDVDPEDVLTAEALKEMGADELKAMGLTPDMRDKLLRGEDVDTGVDAICPACMKRFEEEDYVP